MSWGRIIMSNLKLNPAAVRERAKSVTGCREVFASGDSVISFVVGVHQNQVEALARVNIFFDSGTVGTSRVLGVKSDRPFVAMLPAWML